LAAGFLVGWCIALRLGKTAIARHREETEDLARRMEIGARHIIPAHVAETEGFFALPFYVEHMAMIEDAVYTPLRHKIAGLPGDVQQVATAKPVPAMGIVVDGWAYLIELGDARRALMMTAAAERGRKEKAHANSTAG
jgi:hypothetical protein